MRTGPRSSSHEAQHACPDLRRRRDRRLDRLLPELPRRRGDRHRADRHRLRRVRQVGRVPGARLVRRQSARGPGAAQLCAPRRACPRRSAATGAIAGSPPMAASPARTAASTVDALPAASIGSPTAWPSIVASARRRPPPRFIPAEFTAAMMRAAAGAGRRAASRPGHRPRARRRRPRQRRRGRRRDHRGRCGGDRHGAVVDPGRAAGCRCRPCSA